MKPAAALSSLRLLSAAALAVVLAAPAAAAEPAPAAKPDLAKGQTISTNVCAACHTADGSRGSPANPIIAGQHPEYLVKQLDEFKSGKRDNAVMKGMAATLNEADVKNVAAFYAGQKPKSGFAVEQGSGRLGREALPRRHRDRQRPACAGCHGPTGVGMSSQYPRIAGQHADYVAAQLIAFRGGARKNNVQMTGVTARR